MRRSRALIPVLVAVVLAVTSVVLTASPASAAGPSTVCTGYGGCASAGHSDGGYSAHSGTMYWRQYGGHNCTNYAAYRAIQNGASSGYGPIGNGALDWGQYFSARGVVVNSTPTVGAIAWWRANANSWIGGSGHVAYVEQVRGDGSIVVSEDNGAGGDFHWTVYPSGYLPSGYIHIADRPAVGEGSLISYAGDVYRIAGGAPVYVASYDHIGGSQTTTPVDAATFAGLRTYPADGTLISGQAPGSADHGTVYVVAGGAPVYVASYDHIGGDRGTVGVDLAAIHNAGAGGVWNHLRQQPADGTLIAGQAPGSPDHGTVYVVAGGAPVYVSSYAHIGGDRGTTGVDLAAIDNAGAGGVWNHLRQQPADGTLISGQAPGSPGHGTVYVVAGGAPVYVSSYAHIGGDRGTTGVDLAAIDNAGAGGRWNHLRQQPADGTLISGQAPGSPDHGTVYVVAGGAPVYVSSYASIGGDRGTTGVDLAAIQNGDAGGVWNHLHLRPVDGTRLSANGQRYQVQGGVPVPVGSGATGTVIDAAAVVNAGGTGRWSHLARNVVAAPTASSSAACAGATATVSRLTAQLQQLRKHHASRSKIKKAKKALRTAVATQAAACR